jgi:hypothetical protein
MLTRLTHRARTRRNIVMKAVVGAACLLAIATAIVACGSGNSGAGVAGPPGGVQFNAPPTSAAQPGVPVSALTCDTFPVGDVQTAVEQFASSATATASGGTPSGTGSGLECSYTLSTPGTDLTSASRGQVSVQVTIGDQVTEPEVPSDSTIDYQQEKADFTTQQNKAKSDDNGQPQDDEKPQYRDVPQGGLGEDAYLIDEPHFQSDGTQTDYTTDLWVLHTPRPTSVDITIGYDITQVDGSNPPDKSLDTVLRDDDKRAQLAAAIAKAVLAKIPATVAAH